MGKSRRPSRPHGLRVRTLIATAIPAMLLSAAAPAVAASPNWLPAQRISAAVEVAQDLGVVTSPNGRALAVWISARSGGPTVRAVTRDPSGQWSQPADLGTVHTGATFTSTINDGGDAIVIWASAAGPTAALRPGRAGAWRSPERIPVPSAGPVAIEPSGALVVLSSDAATEASATERPGGSAEFGPTRALSAPGQLNNEPLLSMRPDGAAVAWWLDGFAVRVPGGPFGPSHALPNPSVSSGVEVTLGLSPTGEVLAVRTGVDGLEAASGPPSTALPAYARQAEGIFGAQLAFDDEGDALVLSRRLQERSSADIPVTIVGDRAADGSWGPFRQISPPNLRVVGPRLSANGAGAAVASWGLRRPRGSMISQASVRAADGAAFSAPGDMPDAFGGEGRAAIDDQGDVFGWALNAGAVWVADRTRAVPERPSLSARQVLINQRISQAAVRRANAIDARLREGLTAADIRPGALTAAVFAPGVSLSGQESSAFVPPGTGRPLTIGPPGRGDAAGVRLSAGQLLINQRISQAAVRRASRLARLFEGGLNGAYVVDGALGAGHLAPGLVVGATAVDPQPQRAPGVQTRPRGSADRVSLSAAQLRINQRISQAAVRRLNSLRAMLEDGLPGSAFAPGSITAADLAPELRS